MASLRPYVVHTSLIHVICPCTTRAFLFLFFLRLHAVETIFSYTVFLCLRVVSCLVSFCLRRWIRFFLLLSPCRTRFLLGFDLNLTAFPTPLSRHIFVYLLRHAPPLTCERERKRGAASFMYIYIISIANNSARNFCVNVGDVSSSGWRGIYLYYICRYRTRRGFDIFLLPVKSVHSLRMHRFDASLY